MLTFPMSNGTEMNECPWYGEMCHRYCTRDPHNMSFGIHCNSRVGACAHRRVPLTPSRFAGCLAAWYRLVRSHLPMPVQLKCFYALGLVCVRACARRAPARCPAAIASATRSKEEWAGGLLTGKTASAPWCSPCQKSQWMRGCALCSSMSFPHLELVSISTLNAQP